MRVKTRNALIRDIHAAKTAIERLQLANLMELPAMKPGATIPAKILSGYEITELLANAEDALTAMFNVIEKEMAK